MAEVIFGHVVSHRSPAISRSIRMCTVVAYCFVYFLVCPSMIDHISVWYKWELVARALTLIRWYIWILLKFYSKWVYRESDKDEDQRTNKRTRHTHTQTHIPHQTSVIYVKMILCRRRLFQCSSDFSDWSGTYLALTTHTPNKIEAITNNDKER